jgi:hypothetical protein
MRTTPLVALVLLASTAAFANKPAPPPVGPEPASGKQDAPKAKAEPVDPDRQRVVESQQLRDAADLLRAKYEKDHEGGPPKPEDKKEFEAVVAAYRAAIDKDPLGENATNCRQRLAGALTYAGDREAGLRVLVEAVQLANAPMQEAEACHSAGLHCLQAMNKPGDALGWFRRADGILARIEERELRAKWNAAISNGIARAEAELKK